ncbi:hypothetical protein [Chenggangzhangella methanolivorans]|uniref:Uncharacterized protein n=1 Tax=Chenggangzhangella methanolivorans TaxID=1437009 RepID=A0A9E6R5W8_9HYPH|nr:hypothetical protein [Chenggangzhangella methanolivorans]QZN98468.1 hypothetical protein K6K41_15490 [Chenggangzhangella methanolivorans]
MAIPPISAALPAASVASDVASGDFAGALNNALGLGGGADAKLEEMITQGSVQIMGQMMMRHAGEILNEAMADDEG